MRIPNEVLAPYVGESDSKAPAEAKGAQPVDGSAGLRATLSNSLSKQKQAFEENLERIEQGQNRRIKHGNSGNHKAIQRTGKNGSEERRQGERRKENLPVLLDTRLTRARREAARASAISIKI